MNLMDKGAWSQIIFLCFWLFINAFDNNNFEIYDASCTKLNSKPFWFSGVLSIFIHEPCQNNYHSLTKECPWAERLKVYQRGRWVLLGVFPHLAMKEYPCHVYSNLMPLKINYRTMMYKGATMSFEVKSWWHTALWTAPCSHSLAHGAHCIN